MGSANSLQPVADEDEATDVARDLVATDPRTVFKL